MPGEKQHTQAELAQIYLELTKGEQTATTMENNLDELEKTLDSLLASMEGAMPGVTERHDQDKKKKKKQQEEEAANAKK